MSSNSYNFYPRLDGLQQIDADSINTTDLSTSSLSTGAVITNSVTSTASDQNLTLEALGTGDIIIKSNGNNILIVDDSGTNGKTQANNGLNINNGNLVFSKTSTASQIIDWQTDAGASLGSLFASQLSSAFVFDVNTLTATSFQVRMSGATRFSITDTIATINSLATFNTATNTITLNSKVYQILGDTFISNCSFGYLAGSLLPTSGSITYGTTCIGQEAGRNISGVSGSQGSYNTCVGYKSGRGITTGSQNTVIATESMQSATTASGNVVIGHQTGASLTTGQNNMCLGTGSSFGITTGIDNVSCGYYSGVLQPTLQGAFSQNISFGREANQAVNGGSNIAIGYRANWTTYPALLTAFTNSIVIGNSLNNTLSNQILIGSGSQWLTTPKLSVGKLTSPSTQFDVQGNANITGTITTPTRPAGTSDTTVATTEFVNNVVTGLSTPYTAKYLFDECWDPTYNQCPFGTWDIQGTGGSGVATGTATHPGYYSLQANRAYLSPTVNHYNFRELVFIVRSDNTSNTGDLYCGLCVAYGDYTRGVMIRKTTGTNTFTAVTNNVTKGTFSTVTWINGGWFIYKITFSNPTVTYTITDLTNNVSESITDSTNVFDYANTTKSFLQIAFGGATNTAFLDYFSVSYTVPSRA